MKSKATLFFNAFLVIMFVFAFTLPASAGKTYKLGMSLAITGPTSDAGNPYAKGAEDWFKFVNETDYLGDGDKIDCPIRDDQYKNDTTKRFFEEFLDDGILIFLSYATGGNLALKRDFEEVQIPVIPASYHEGLIVDANYTFMPVATYSENAVGLAEYVVEKHKGTDTPQVAFFIHPSAFGRGPLEDTRKAIAEGLKIDIVEVVEHGTDLDNTAMLQRLQSKGVQYVICHTVQTPVATMLTDAQRLGVSAASFGEKGKLTFLGAHYTGGSDLIALAGTATEGYIWADSYNLTSEKNEKAKKQLELAERYGRDDKAANSHNYAAGILAAQIATEAIKETKKAGLKINRENIYKTMQALNFNSFAAAGPVTYSPTERIGVDVMNIYVAKDGVFKKIQAFESQYIQKVRAGR
ncbi:MAG: ABC transporter substrate-binding protein [Desulfotignum sp.]|nr:ABC transporter substrate-binding protein [Desulfotignum sp.]MCF8137247.1 ABC transporter substrate-binding protein [Desulfotignum sp.]